MLYNNMQRESFVGGVLQLYVEIGETSGDPLSVAAPPDGHRWAPLWGTC